MGYAEKCHLYDDASAIVVIDMELTEMADVAGDDFILTPLDMTVGEALVKIHNGTQEEVSSIIGHFQNLYRPDEDDEENEDY